MCSCTTKHAYDAPCECECHGDKLNWDEATKRLVEQDRPRDLSFMKFASEEMHSLFVDMLRRHKTFKERDIHSYNPDKDYIVKCPSCDGNVVQMWRVGDKEYKCEIWTRAEKLGLTDGL